MHISQQGLDAPLAQPGFAKIPSGVEAVLCCPSLVINHLPESELVTLSSALTADKVSSLTRKSLCKRRRDLGTFWPAWFVQTMLWTRTFQGNGTFWPQKSSNPSAGN